MIKVVRQPLKNEKLQKLVAFLWHLTSTEAVAVNHKLLPDLNTDLLINLAEPIFYRFTDTGETEAPKMHIRFVKKQPQFIRQSGKLNVWGIAFYAFGLYPFLHIPMHKLEGSVLEVANLDTVPLAGLDGRLKQVDDDAAGFAVMEAALLQWLGSGIDDDAIALMNSFLAQMPNVNIGAFCRTHNISIKTLERRAKQYTGLTPKQLQQIGRFKAAGDNLVYGKNLILLTDLAYDYDYYDQTHFIKDFKAFSGSTPGGFVKENNSVKKMLK